MDSTKNVTQNTDPKTKKLHLKATVRAEHASKGRKLGRWQGAVAKIKRGPDAGSWVLLRNGAVVDKLYPKEAVAAE